MNIEVLNMVDLKNNNRYSDYKFLDKPTKFAELFKDKNYLVVQIQDTTPISEINDIVGFAGAFKWEDNKITSLDGDSYSEETIIIGYDEFEYEGQICLDILATEW